MKAEARMLWLKQWGGLCGSASICIHQRNLWLRQMAEPRLQPW
jgi:hypothetical protein